MATKLKKMADQLDANFRDCLDAEFEKRFNVRLITSWNFFEMSLVSTRLDGQELTKEQVDFISAYSDGYAAAMLQVKTTQ